MFPAVFVNHGGGPLPLLGRQPQLVDSMKAITKSLPKKPKAIVVFSAHWESSANEIEITSNAAPSMLYDYGGFPSQCYEYQYPAPGSPDLAQEIHEMLQKSDIPSRLNPQRGYDHGVFVPLMLMYPQADIPVVCVSLHASLATDVHQKIGAALAPLRTKDVLILGSGYTFHNLPALFHPSSATMKAARDFDDWVKDHVHELDRWESAPGARVAHPRAEHFIPLVMVAATGGKAQRFSIDENGSHAVSSFVFH